MTSSKRTTAIEHMRAATVAQPLASILLALLVLAAGPASAAPAPDGPDTSGSAGRSDAQPSPGIPAAPNPSGAPARLAQLSGTVLLTRANGKLAILARDSAIGAGDTVQTQAGTYAGMVLSDGTQIALEPDTILRLERYAFDASRPQADDAAYTLVRGGVRVTAGELGRRSPSRHVLSTSVSTLGLMAATVYVVVEPERAIAHSGRQAWMMASTASLEKFEGNNNDNRVGNAAAVRATRPLMLAQVAPTLPSPSAPITRAPGLYVQVLDGLVNVSNSAGSLNFSAGQFGYTPGFAAAPVLIPNNPGLQFNPPPSFSQTAPQAAGAAALTKGGAVDCEVR